MDNFIYLIVIVLPILVAIKLIHSTKGICYFGPALTTDNEKIVKASSVINPLSWPSKMHSIEYNRSQLREYWTICLHYLGIVKKDNLSDHMNVSLALIANSVTSILIFFVFKILFGNDIAFIIFLLYLTSQWPYHVAMYMGHIHLAQMFFLVSVLLLLLTSYVNFTAAIFLFFLGGIFSFVSFFSSSASRKYPPMSFIALLYMLRDYFYIPWESNFFIENLSYIIASTIFFLAILISRRFIVDSLIRLIFNKVDMSPEKAKEISSKSKEISSKLLVLVSALYFVLMVIISFFSMTYYFILPMLSYILGAIIVIAHILLPPKTLLNNTMRYYAWLDVSSWASHFNSYPDKIKTFGVDIPHNFKGAGISWVHFLFLRFMPFIYPLYVVSIVYLFSITYLIGDGLNLGLFMFAIFVSILPILIHEFTGGLKVGKAFFVAELFLFVVIALALEEFTRISGNSISGELFFWIIGILIIAQLFHSTYILFSDTIPCRMAPTILRNKLKELNVSSFYTYDNSYNDPFVSAMIASYPDEFEVKYIENMSEVSEGVIVIPATSSKSVTQETQQYAIINGDFDKDSYLNKLLLDKSIETEAVFKIPTAGSSKYYVHESEVTSYRYIVLKQINEYDRWLGNAWILVK
jgi:hypothetical protein